MTASEALKKLAELESALYALRHSMSILYTDGQTVAPKNSWRGRGRAMSYLSEMEYRLMDSPETGEMLSVILADSQKADPVSFRRAEVLKEAYDDIHVLPLEEYVAWAELTNEASAVWHDAKSASDYAAFSPYLEKIIAGRRRFAALKNASAPAYDVLLDTFEKGSSMAMLDPFFRTLREELSPLIREVAARPKPTPAFMQREWPVAAQRRFSDLLMAWEGISPDNCSLGETEHPFTDAPNKWDARITTNYRPDVFSSMFSVIHEGGHAIYEMNVQDDLQFTALAGGSTMGLHESQSRFYENLIARSRAFCAPLLGMMREAFPDNMIGVTEEDLYSAVNLASPSLIRTEADELTYSLHVMIRYELEKSLIAGDLTVRDLPAAWNDLYQSVLGVDVPDDRRGVLQDSHWSGGALGYFPSYALGSAYGVQMLHHMERDIPVWDIVARGELAPVTSWLTEHVHRWGNLKKPQEILSEAMGGPLDARVYTDYLKRKFSELYAL